jgi:hypothetical protein
MRLQLDCLLCMGYIAYDEEEWEISKQAFEQAYYVIRTS